jgi:hypothetical protein
MWNCSGSGCVSSPPDLLHDETTNVRAMMMGMKCLMRFLLILPQNYAFSNTSHLISRFLFCFSLTLHYLCGSAAKVLPFESTKNILHFTHLIAFELRSKAGFGSEKKAKNFVFCFAFRSPCTTFELRSKVLTFEKSQINLDFCSLNRTFAA